VERYGNALRDFWGRIDAIVGEFVAATDENTILFVVSDHGFAPIDREMRVLRWLWDEKYTALNPLRSRVFYFPHFGGEVTINLAGRFPEGVVKPGEPYEELIAELRSKLLAVRDPAKGKAPIQAVFRADSLYAGPYAGNAPDLLFLPEPGYVFGRGSPFEEGGVFQDPSYTFSAFHDMRGIFLARGPHVTRGSAEQDLHLIDLTPTVLRVLGETIPVAMDGRPFASPFDEGFARAAPLRVGKRSIERTERSSVAEEMREKLEAIEALPYLQ
jgi:predicted AlkP superfamily phosphohydrolase/phosphomutase